MTQRWATMALAAILTFGGVAGATAQQATVPCEAPEYRQFDFWVGEWEVRDAEGKMAGTNIIDRMLSNCVLRERWTGSAGTLGQSFNLYWARDQRWHQTWVDNQGGLLELAGGLEGDAMVMQGEGIARDGSAILHEIRWEPLDDGRVKQHWRASRDQGTSWDDLFVGFYSKKE